MGMYLEKGYELRLCDFDRYGRIQPAAILDILQEIATLQAANIGVGLEDMQAMGVLWMIVRMKYEIVREPQMHERVIARTWPHSLTRFSFLRDFSVKDEDGELLIKASSEWVIVDAQTHKFASIADYYHGSLDFEEDRAFDTKLKKLWPLPDDDIEPHIRIPGYTDVDLNGHVNNSRYANYIIDALSPGPEGHIKSFQIEYRKEALEGQPLAIRTQEMEDGSIMTKGSNDEGETVFSCRIISDRADATVGI